jgi:glycosyltransferase involved in cell wall biosynthesis
MKISIFSAFPPFRGGISQFSTKLSEALEKKHELVLITFKKQYPDWLFPGKSQYDFNQEINLKAKINRIISTFSINTYFKAISFINKEKTSVFITNYWMTFFGPFMGFIARKLSKKTIKIAIVHNLIPHEKRFFDRTFNSYFLKSYDGYVALSEYVYNDLKKFVDEKKIIHIPHPTYNQFGEKINRNEACLKLNIDSSKHIILFFGIIRKYKGLDLLIEAFDALDDSFQLIIAGEVYGKEDEITDLIAKNKNKERILFHNNFIPDSEISTYFSASDYLVLPYRSGTQSGVSAIANHFAIPILATDTGGLTESLNTETDIIIKQADPESILHAMEESKNKMFNSASMKNEPMQSISWESFSDKLEEFIKSLRK